MDKLPKFIQIATGQYVYNDCIQHSVYALGADGHVYKYSFKEGWTKLINPPGKRQSPPPKGFTPVKPPPQQQQVFGRRKTKEGYDADPNIIDDSDVPF
jgi:hypothetical protein